jgi:hypothetical protein
VTEIKDRLDEEWERLNRETMSNMITADPSSISYQQLMWFTDALKFVAHCQNIHAITGREMYKEAGDKIKALMMEACDDTED